MVVIITAYISFSFSLMTMVVIITAYISFSFSLMEGGYLHITSTLNSMCTDTHGTLE